MARLILVGIDDDLFLVVRANALKTVFAVIFCGNAFNRDVNSSFFSLHKKLALTNAVKAASFSQACIGSHFMHIKYILNFV